jgi:hypothetical protein
MGKIPMITARDPKHAKDVQENAQEPIEQSSACPDSRERQQVHNGKRNFLLKNGPAPDFG